MEVAQEAADGRQWATQIVVAKKAWGQSQWCMD